VFDELKSIAGSNFEAVDTSVMMIDPNSAAAKQSGTPSTTNYQALWWRSPAASESGWGVNITHQGNQLFATWFTYDVNGAPQWFAVSNAYKVGEGIYSGGVYRYVGPAFDATPWNPLNAVGMPGGKRDLRIQRCGQRHVQLHGRRNHPVETDHEVRIRAARAGLRFRRDAGRPTQLHDLWWRSPAASESGWGVNLAHQGDLLFATWFTYDVSGKPLWLVMSNGIRVGNATWSGTLYRTNGPAFDKLPWNPSQVAYTQVGTATFSFTDASNGSFAYTVNGISQSKPITRYAFASPATCLQIESRHGQTTPRPFRPAHGTARFSVEMSSAGPLTRRLPSRSSIASWTSASTRSTRRTAIRPWVPGHVGGESETIIGRWLEERRQARQGADRDEGRHARAGRERPQARAGGEARREFAAPAADRSHRSLPDAQGRSRDARSRKRSKHSVAS
jgi:hypothetical protein